MSDGRVQDEFPDLSLTAGTVSSLMLTIPARLRGFATRAPSQTVPYMVWQRFPIGAARLERGYRRRFHSFAARNYTAQIRLDLFAAPV